MIRLPEAETAALDATVRERLAAMGPFDPTYFQPEVLRDALALARRWRSALLAETPGLNVESTNGHATSRSDGRR
jgi:hypothetical protein